MVIKKCRYCNEEFNAPRRSTVFCSVECLIKGKNRKGNPPELCKHGNLGKKKCKLCMTEYWREHSYKRRRKAGMEQRQFYSKEEKKLRQHKQQKEIHKRNRLITLIYYGGNPPKCFCCGESNIEFLCIDHIEGNGNSHRKSIGGTLYEWLRRENYPKGFRVLCHNCNMSLGFYGYCPHKRNINGENTI